MMGNATWRIDIGLLRAAQAEFAGLILPSLPGELRYAGAMLKRTLDVLAAQAEAASPPEATLGEAGFGTAQALAAGLRARTVQDDAALRRALRSFVERKLAITNPRFLAQTNALPAEARL